MLRTLAQFIGMLGGRADSIVTTGAAFGFRREGAIPKVPPEGWRAAFARCGDPGWQRGFGWTVRERRLRPARQEVFAGGDERKPSGWCARY